MNLETLLSSKSWVLAVPRGYPGLPLNDTVFYKYTFAFPATEGKYSTRIRGWLTVESCTMHGKALIVRNGINQCKVHNPFSITYSDAKHAVLTCHKLHAHSIVNKAEQKHGNSLVQSAKASGKLVYDFIFPAPLMFTCQLRSGIWQLCGSMYDARAFFTPNQSWHDHFGYWSLFTSKMLSGKMMIHVSSEGMSFHILIAGLGTNGNLFEWSVCHTVDESQLHAEEDPDGDFDLENQLPASTIDTSGNSDITPLPTSPSTTSTLSISVE